MYRPALPVVLLLAACASPQRANLDAFETVLASQDSATAALEQWCAARRLANPPLIRAEPVAGSVQVEPPGLRMMLGSAGTEPIGYRHVRLRCGNAVLSEAHNWFLPSRLSADMNDKLRNSDAPFGKVAAPLGFRRERIDTGRGRANGCPAGTIASHRALLRLPGGEPLALVVECYTGANLGRGD